MLACDARSNLCSALPFIALLILLNTVDTSDSMTLKSSESRYNAIRGHVSDRMSAKISEPFVYHVFTIRR